MDRPLRLAALEIIVARPWKAGRRAGDGLDYFLCRNAAIAVEIVAQETVDFGRAPAGIPDAVAGLDFLARKPLAVSGIADGREDFREERFKRAIADARDQVLIHLVARAVVRR
ncbi:MAG: hypothetical protein J0H84_21235 [Rhizobiales bacterium]|nr:hypothetical protein [Hyphomicrobiales bacterium]